MFYVLTLFSAVLMVFLMITRPGSQRDVPPPPLATNPLDYQCSVHYNGGTIPSFVVLDQRGQQNEGQSRIKDGVHRSHEPFHDLSVIERRE